MKKEVVSGFRLAIAYQLVMWGIVILFHGIPMTEWNSSEVLAISVGMVLYVCSIIFYLGKTKKLENKKKFNLKRFEFSFLTFYSILTILFGIIVLDFVEKGVLYACSGDACLLNASFYIFFAIGLLIQVVILTVIRVIQGIIKKKEKESEEARKIVLVKFSKVDEVNNAESESIVAESSEEKASEEESNTNEVGEEDNSFSNDENGGNV